MRSELTLTPQELAEESAKDANLLILDARWFLDGGSKKAYQAFLEARIPNSTFFDIDDIADGVSGLPHMLPSPAQFALAVGRLGADRETKIIAYDDVGLWSAPRVWWSFRTMGHDNVAVLEGGMEAWMRSGFPLETGTPDSSVQPRVFHPDFQSARVINRNGVRQALKTRNAVILDARSAERFAGTKPEPRSGLRSGHMPGARNIPFGLVNAGKGVLRPPEELRALFGLETDTPIITSCGSGITACVLALALESAGYKNVAVYDGSWCEWGAHPDSEIEISEFSENSP